MADFRIGIGSYGKFTIYDNAQLAERVRSLRERVAGNKANSPYGRRIADALFRFESHVRELAGEQVGGPLLEQHDYTVAGVSLDALEEAEHINEEGRAAARAQGPTYECAMRGCQNRTTRRGDYCVRCEHDER